MKRVPIYFFIIFLGFQQIATSEDSLESKYKLLMNGLDQDIELLKTFDNCEKYAQAAKESEIRFTAFKTSGDTNSMIHELTSKSVFSNSSVSCGNVRRTVINRLFIKDLLNEVIHLKEKLRQMKASQ